MGCGASSSNPPPSSREWDDLYQGIGENRRKRGFIRNNRNFGPDGDPNPNGLRKRLRRIMAIAVGGESIRDITSAIELYDKYDMEKDDNYPKAKKKLEFLLLKNELREALRRRHAGVLQDTIVKVQGSEYFGRLRSQVNVAERLRDQLLAMGTLKHDILEMEQTTISEIRSFKNPPSCLLRTMQATYLLLGTPPAYLKDWADIQTLLGRINKEHILRLIETFDVTSVSMETAQQAERLLGKRNFETVRNGSIGVARFHLWASSVTEKVLRGNTVPSRLK